MNKTSLLSVLENPDRGLLDVVTHAPGPAGALPLTAGDVAELPSGNLFGMSQNVGMGWDRRRIVRP